MAKLNKQQINKQTIEEKRYAKQTLNETNSSIS